MKTESSHPFMLSKDIQYPMRKFGARGVYDTLLATLAIPDEQSRRCCRPGWN